MTKRRIWVSKEGKGRTLYIELSVYRNGPGLTISCPDDKEFKFYTNDSGLRKFAEKLDELFQERVESALPTSAETK